MRLQDIPNIGNALDVENEQIVLASLDRLAPRSNCTRVIVVKMQKHRLTTARCDLIMSFCIFLAMLSTERVAKKSRH